MPGFSYGGKGDGTNWSSERGSGPEPGGGSTGNSGNNQGGGTASPAQKQLAAIRSDKAVRTKLAKLIEEARKINPSMKMTIARVTPEGVMVISVEGLNADQARQIGLVGLVMGVSVPGYIGAVGDLETGHRLSITNPEKNSYYGGVSVDEFISGQSPDRQKVYKDWLYDVGNSFSYTGGMPAGVIHHVTVSTVDNVDTYTLYYKNKKDTPAFKVTVRNGDISSMTVSPVGKPIFSEQNARTVVSSLAAAKKDADKEVLIKASEVIVSVGDKAGAYLGDKYKALSREIAENIRNFQGKRIRSYNEAMASVNKLMANPTLKINAADRDAIVNAWRAFNADDMGNKFAALGKTFKVTDYAMKANNVREKSIEGYQTGNWGPLMREVESWVVSGIASSVALAIFSATLGAFLIAAGVSAVVAGIIGIIIAGLIGAFIDDKFIDRLNNEIFRPAH